METYREPFDELMTRLPFFQPSGSDGANSFDIHAPPTTRAVITRLAMMPFHGWMGVSSRPPGIPEVKAVTKR